jgi:light-independent protochlorophyllide reductase subunit B
MQLAVWTYEGPPHVGAMRIATAMEGLHYVLHAPQGDTYADLLFTMIERKASGRRSPTPRSRRAILGGHGRTVQGGTRCLCRALQAPGIAGAAHPARPSSSRTTPAAWPRRLDLDIPVVPVELPSYQKKENWGAAETFYQLVRRFAAGRRLRRQTRPVRAQVTCNLLGATALGFRHRDDVVE